MAMKIINANNGKRKKTLFIETDKTEATKSISNFVRGSRLKEINGLFGFEEEMKAIIVFPLIYSNLDNSF